MTKEELREVFDRMVEKWPSEFVARKKVEQFTGGLVTGKTLANYDSLKQGPPRIKIGRNTGYPKAALTEWLKARTVFGE